MVRMTMPQPRLNQKFVFRPARRGTTTNSTAIAKAMRSVESMASSVYMSEGGVVVVVEAGADAAPGEPGDGGEHGGGGDPSPGGLGGEKRAGGDGDDAHNRAAPRGPPARGGGGAR